MAIYRKSSGNSIYIHEGHSCRDPEDPKRVHNPSVLIGKVIRETNEDFFYPEYREGLLGIAKGKFHSIQKLKACRKKNPQRFERWRQMRLAKLASSTPSPDEENIIMTLAETLTTMSEVFRSIGKAADGMVVMIEHILHLISENTATGRLEEVVKGEFTRQIAEFSQMFSRLDATMAAFDTGSVMECNTPKKG
jgi:uncharacterized damage-inducible protein DinB